jgi:hypothetical protein
VGSIAAGNAPSTLNPAEFAEHIRDTGKRVAVRDLKGGQVWFTS